MEVSKFNFHNLRNAAHYQFHSDFVTLVERYTPQELSIEELYALYTPQYDNEGVALVAISKSEFTEVLEEADKSRDQIYRGTIDDVSSKVNHFKADVREAAKKVKIISDSYGNLAPKPYDEESAFLTSLIDDIRTKAPAEMVLLNLKDWIEELEVRNNAVITIQSSRNSQEADRTELRMKDVRVEVDAAYNKIVKRINALIELNGEDTYAGFVKELNARIERAQIAVAQSRAKKSTTAAEAQKAE